MKYNRILFKNNPWPEGHPIKEFRWSARIRYGQVWCDLYLKSADYDHEREIENDESIECDWESPIVWTNYNCCTISGSFPLCPPSVYSPSFIDGKIFKIDSLPLPLEIESLEDLVFETYLLGHDSVADHKIQFKLQENTNKFEIHWSGKIALVYVGDYEYKYEFEAKLSDVPFPILTGCDKQSKNVTPQLPLF